jgi:hypothetical protein
MRSGLALAWIAAATACVGLGCGESRLGSAGASRSAGMGPALRAALAEGSRLERFRVLTEALDGLEPDNLAEAVAVYDGELSSLSDCEIGIFVDAWTRFDPLSAVEHVQHWPHMSKRKVGLETAIQGWALRRPEEARVAVEEMMEDHPPLKMPLIENLVLGWTYSGSPGVVAFVGELPTALRSRANVAMVGAQTRRLGAAGLLSWADEVFVELEGKLEFQRGFFRRVAHAAGRRDPERVAAWAGRHAGSGYGADGRRIVGQHWVKRDPVATLEWLSAEAADEEGAEAIRRVLSRWLEQDRPAAEEWLDSASPATLPDPALDFYARDLVTRLEIEMAISWAESIRDESLREASLKAVATPWYRREPEAAEAWLQQSSLSEEAREAVRHPPAE